MGILLAKKFFQYRMCTRTLLEFLLLNKPFPAPATLCFSIGIFLPIMLRGLFGPLAVELYSVSNALANSVVIGISAVVLFWSLSWLKKKEGMFSFLCTFLGIISGIAAIRLYQGVDTMYAIMCFVASCILTCLAYQYFVKKIKT